MNDPITPAPRDPSSAPSTPSSTGLDTTVAGPLCYLLGFITGLVFLVLEKNDRDVRFHAYQSLATFLALFVVSVVASAIPVLGVLVQLLLTPLSLVLWVLLMWKAFQGERFKLPWAGDWAEEQVAC